MNLAEQMAAFAKRQRAQNILLAKQHGISIELEEDETITDVINDAFGAAPVEALADKVEWELGFRALPGTVVKRKGRGYRCTEAHITQEGLEPCTTCGLWVDVEERDIK